MLPSTANNSFTISTAKTFRRNLSVLWLLLCFVLIQICNNSPLFSQQADYVGLEDGLSSGFVFDFRQSSEGFMYIGLHSGLNRYDGYEMRHYKHNPFDPYSISANAVNNILEDRRGYIWVAMESGELDVLNPRSGRFHHLGSFGQQMNSHHKVIQTIFFDDQGNLWLGLLSGKVYKLKIPADFNLSGKPASIPFQAMVDYEFEVEPNPNFEPIYEVSRKPIRTFLQDKKKQLWMRTHDAQLFKIDHKENEHEVFFQSKRYYQKEPQLLEDPDGVIWLTTGLNWQKVKQQKVEEVPVSPWFTDAFIHGWDANGELIYDIRPRDSKTKIYRSSESVFSRKAPKAKLLAEYPTAAIRIIRIDDSGLLWMKGNIGLVKISPEEELFEHHLKGISLGRLKLDHRGGGYFTEGRSGRLLYDKNESFPITKQYPNLPFKGSIVFKKDGTIWGVKSNVDGDKTLKIEKPFFLIRPETEEIIEYQISGYYRPSESSTNRLDKEERVWSFNNNQLFLFDLENLSAKSFSIMKNEENVIRSNDLFIDYANDFWIATINGACKTNSSKLPAEEIEAEWFYNDPDNPNSLSHSSIKCFHDDPFEPEKYMWIGTAGGGLNRLNRKTKEAIHYTTLNSEIPDDVVYQIQTDAKGYLWMSTNNGLARFDTKKEKFKNYTKEDGLQDLEFNTLSSIRLPDGEMAFGGINGLNIFNPDVQNMEGSTYIPPVRLTSLRINNQKIQPYPVTDSTGFELEQSLEYTNSIGLTHLQNTIRIEFAALDFYHKNQNQYRYRLTEGSERAERETKAWVNLETENKVQFTSLPSGEYLFEVMGSNHDEVWNTEPTTLEITIHPPWWKSKWVYMAYALLFLGAVFGVHRFQTNRLNLRNQLSYEKATAERLLELDKLKTNFFSNVTHELRTPLTLILGPLQKVLKSNDLSNKNFTLLKVMQQNGGNLLKLINEILDLNKLEAGKLELHEKPVPLYLLLQRLVSVFESYSERKEVTFSFEYKGSPHLQVQLDQVKFEKVVNNLLSNAIKFTPNKGSVNVLLEDKGQSLELKVSDTGRGIHEEDLPHIFDRFYQTKSPDEITEGGTGIGLALVQEYARLFKGSVEVKSKIGEGSAFVFSFPKKEVFKTLETEDVLAIDKILKNEDRSFLIKGNITKELQDAAEEVTQGSTEELLARKKLLVVEDNLQLRDYLLLLLGEYYQVFSANNGKAALDWLDEQSVNNNYPDLILSDVMMPVMDGFQFLETIKQKQQYCSIPVVMLTAKAATPDKLKALRIGVDDYMIKPFLEEELLIRIENLLSNAQVKQEYHQEEAELDSSINQNDQSNTGSKPAEQKRVKPSPATSISPEDLEWLGELEKTVMESLSDFDFTLDRLGPMIFLSPRQIRRRLKQLTGLSFSQYLREARFGEARRLLESGEVSSVKGVAYEIGMRDVKYFSREFKKHFGKSPSTYLEE